MDHSKFSKITELFSLIHEPCPIQKSVIFGRHGFRNSQILSIITMFSCFSSINLEKFSINQGHKDTPEIQG